MARNNEFTKLADVVEVMEVPVGCLKGKRICITGHLGKPRQEIARIIEQGGGIFHDTVKYDTTHLLTNADWTTTKGSTSSKYQKARSYGCKFINEAEFFAMLTAVENAA
jgi:NAD-dependent DNA ligase